MAAKKITKAKTKKKAPAKNSDNLRKKRRRASGKRYNPKEEDRQFVVNAIQAGMTHKEICSTLNIHNNTLRKYFKYEICVAKAHLLSGAVQTLRDACDGGSVDAAKYILSRKAKWTESVNVAHEGEIKIIRIIDDIPKDAK